MTDERRRALRRAWIATTVFFAFAMMIPYAGLLGVRLLWSLGALSLWIVSIPGRPWVRLTGIVATLFAAIGVHALLWTSEVQGVWLLDGLTSALVAFVYLWPIAQAAWAWRLLAPRGGPAPYRAPAP